MVRVLILFVVLAQLALHAEGKFGSAASLENAIRKANDNAKVCNLKPGCFGKAVVLILTQSIQLNKLLPPLNYNARLIVVGSCGRLKSGAVAACTIDGARKYSLFTFPSAGNFGYPKLDLRNLIVQNFQGGVLGGSLFVTTDVRDVIFRNNVNGVVTSGYAPGGIPKQFFDKCRFVNNNGSTISIGSIKYGLARDGTALYVKRSIFRGNYGGKENNVVYIAGAGVAQFEDVKFYKNKVESADGGAVYVDESQVIFRKTSFVDNVSVFGKGGAVAGTSGPFNNLTVSFCSSSFSNNKAINNFKSRSLFLFAADVDNYGSVTNGTVNFCDTKTPDGSVLPQPPSGKVNTGLGGRCSNQYCKVTK